MTAARFESIWLDFGRTFETVLFVIIIIIIKPLSEKLYVAHHSSSFRYIEMKSGQKL